MLHMNHRERRVKAKLDATTQTCPTHPHAKMIAKGTQVICPQCYREALRAKELMKRAKDKDKVVL